MSATLEGQITYEEYKRMASEFFKRCNATPTPTEKQLESGLHMLRIGYLSLNSDNDAMWIGSAIILLEMAQKKADEIIIAEQRNQAILKFNRR